MKMNSDEKTSVLLADDEDIILFTIGGFLRDQGHDVKETSSLKGIRMMAPEANIWIIDARLSGPEANGVKVVGEILRQQKIEPHVVIIFISNSLENDPSCQAALGKFPDEFKLNEPGRTRYVWLRKPVEFFNLAATIADEIAQRRCESGDISSD